MKLFQKKSSMGVLFTFLMIALIAGCQAIQVAQSPTATATPTVIAENALAVENVRSLLARQLQIDPITIEIISDEEVEWPDACLGVSLPNEVCAAVITPGHKIMLRANGQEYVFHSNGTGANAHLVVAPADATDANGVAINPSEVNFIQAVVNLNIRSGPGTNYEVIGRVAEGQIAKVTGITADNGWWRVICPDDSVGDCFVINDPALAQATSVDMGEGAPSEQAELLTYVNEEAGFSFDYPASWSFDMGEVGSRGGFVQYRAPDGTVLAATLLDWDPKNDLTAYVENRKVAWDASGMKILDEQVWTVDGDHPAMRFLIRSADGSEDAFFLLTMIGNQYLTLSGSGGLDDLAAVAQSLKVSD